MAETDRSPEPTVPDPRIPGSHDVTTPRASDLHRSPSSIHTDHRRSTQIIAVDSHGGLNASADTGVPCIRAAVSRPGRIIIINAIRSPGGFYFCVWRVLFLRWFSRGRRYSNESRILGNFRWHFFFLRRGKQNKSTIRSCKFKNGPRVRITSICCVIVRFCSKTRSC